MQVSVETVGNLERRMTFRLPAERIDTQVGGRLREIARTARIKGFRPGKVPTKVIEQRYGQQVRAEILDGMLRESFDMNRRELPADHPTIAAGAAGLANLLIGERGYAEAERLVEESLDIRRRTLGDESPQVGGSLTVKANLLVARRQFAEARQVAAQARRILEANLPEDHWQVAMAQNAEGAARAGLGDYQHAESLLLSSLPTLGGSPLPGLEKTGRERLARLYTAWGKPDKAGQYQAN